MTDIATLGIAVDSRPVEKATTELDQLAGAAKRAETSTGALSKTQRTQATASQQVAEAADRAASSIVRQSVATNDNIARTNRMGGSMSGLAAQFQDIGVTAAAGMSPLQIALQQGTQIAGQMEMAIKGGTSALGVLGSAFKSLLSPVALASIGLTAVVAAGIQMIDWTKVAAGAMRIVADGLELVAPYAAVAAGGLALLYAPAILGGMQTVIVALGSVTAAAIKAGIALVAANPAGALVLGFAAAATAAVIFRDDLTRLLGFDLVGEVDRAVNNIIGLFVGAYDVVRQAWGNLPTFFGALGKQAWNNLVAEFEKPALTIGGQTIIPGFDLSGMKSALSASEQAAFGEATTTFGNALGRNYTGAAFEVITTAASGAAGKLREMAAGFGAVESASDKAAKATTKTTDAVRSLADSGVTFFNGFSAAIRGGASAFDWLAQRALSALDSIADRLANQALGGFLNSIFGGLFGAGLVPGSLYAKGAAFQAGNVIPFAAGGIVDRPTSFPMSGGRTGLMGEAGPEAIVPLSRGPGGRLGVTMSGAKTASGDIYTINIDARGAQQGVGDEIERAIHRAIDDNNRKVVPRIVFDAKHDTLLQTGQAVA